MADAPQPSVSFSPPPRWHVAPGDLRPISPYVAGLAAGLALLPAVLLSLEPALGPAHLSVDAARHWVILLNWSGLIVACGIVSLSGLIYSSLRQPATLWAGLSFLLPSLMDAAGLLLVSKQPPVLAGLSDYLPLWFPGQAVRLILLMQCAVFLAADSPKNRGRRLALGAGIAVGWLLLAFAAPAVFRLLAGPGQPLPSWLVELPGVAVLLGLAGLASLWLARSRGRGAANYQLTLLVMMAPLLLAQLHGLRPPRLGAGAAALAVQSEVLFAGILLFFAFWQDALQTFWQKRRQEEALRAEHAQQIQDTQQELQRSILAQETQAEITKLLHFSLENIPFEAVFEKILGHLTGIAWLNLQPRWVLLTTDPADDLLRIAYQRGLDEPDLFICPGLTRYTPEGLDQAAYYFDSSLHENPDPVVHADGRCCVPLISTEDRLLGLIVLFFKNKLEPESRVHFFLFSVAKVIVGILKRAQIEQELRAERDKVKSYLTLASVAFLVLDPDLTVRWINHKTCEILGLSEDEILGKNWSQSFVPPRDRMKATGFYSRLMNSTSVEVDYGEHAVLTAQNEERLLAWHSKVFRAEDGSVQTILSSGEDVTEREKADNALWESLVRYGRFFEDSPVAIWEKDFNRVREYLSALTAAGVNDLPTHLADHPEDVRQCLDLLQVVDVNQSSVELFGAQDKEDLKSRWRELMPPESLELFKSLLASLSGESTYFEGETQMRKFGGGLIQVVQRISILAEERGAWSKALVTFVDITERKRMETTLQESSARYSRFFEDSPVSLWEADSTELTAFLQSLAAAEPLEQYFDGHPDALLECLTLIKIRDCNQTSLKLFQAENKSVLLARWHELLVEESLPVFKGIVLAMGRGQNEFEDQIVFASLGGRRIHAVVRTSLITGEDTSRRIYLLSINDVTERILMENALRQSEEKHRVVMDNIGIGVAMISPKFEIITLNSQMRQWNPTVDIGQRPVCYRTFNIPPHDSPCSYCPVRMTFEDGLVHEAITNTPSENEIKHFRVVSSPLKDKAGNITAAIEMVEDITHRQRAEAALHKAHERIERLFSSLPSVLISLDGTGGISHWNPAAEAAFGIPAAQAVKRPFREIEIQWNWNELLRAFETCRADGSHAQIRDFRYRQPDGKDGFMDLTLTPMRETSSENIEILLLGTDVTENKLLVGQLLQAQKLESIGQLAAGIAHEINTPTQYVGDNIRFLQEATADLNHMLESYGRLQASMQTGTIEPALMAEVAAQQAAIDLTYLQAEVPKAIAESLEGVERVTTIVRAMKEFAHPDTGEKVPLDLNQAIASTITVARNEWKYVAELAADFDPDLPVVPCLAGEFNQVILNLIVNAAHAIGDVVAGTNRKGKITVTTRRNRGWVVITVADTGTGIPEGVLPKIFDPFFTTKKVGKGTGQGLAISRNVIVEKHHGTIDVQTKLGEGTTFIVTLPLA